MIFRLNIFGETIFLLTVIGDDGMQYQGNGVFVKKQSDSLSKVFA